MTATPCQVVLLTPPGRGAVATVLVAGLKATAIVERHFQAAAGKPLRDFPLGRIVFGRWRATEVGVLSAQYSVLSTSPETLSVGEEIVVCRTAEHEVEIHCHGGSAASRAMIDALVADGCTACDWQAWLRSASPDPLAAAAHVALAAATTTRTALILLDQLHGALRREVEAILAALEAGDVDRAQSRLEALHVRGRFGLHLTQPWRVVLAGHPNVGKSSLMNAMLGYTRAIVFDEPGTTRDVLTAATAIDGWPVELSDTAGLRPASDEIETEGVARARRAASSADLLVLVFDATQPWSASDQLLIEEHPQSLVVLNKCDLSEVGLATCPHLATSALTGEGIPELVRAIGQRLVPAPPQRGDAVPFLPDVAEAITGAHASVVRNDFASAADCIVKLL